MGGEDRGVTEEDTSGGGKPSRWGSVVCKGETVGTQVSSLGGGSFSWSSCSVCSWRARMSIWSPGKGVGGHRS